MGLVNISNIDKAALLEALWHAQREPGFYATPPFDREAVSETISRGYIDYFCGKAIKMDLSGDKVNPYLYERDAGAGIFLRILSTLQGQCEDAPVDKPDLFSGH